MIEEMRAKLNQIDEEIISLLSRRAEISTKVGVEKNKQGLPLLDANREREILSTLEKKSQAPLDAAAVVAIYKAILVQMRRLQSEAIQRAEALRG